MLKKVAKAPKQTDPLRQKLKKKIWTAVGSLVLFFSWVSQSYFQEKWHGEVERIERNKLGIAFNEVNKNLYQIFLNEEQSRILLDSNYDSNLMLAFHAYDIYANLLQYLGTTLTTDSTEYLKANEEVFKQNLEDITNWAKNGELEKLKWFAGKLSNWESKNGTKVIGTYQARLAEIRKKEEFWSTTYLVLYILGVSILGYAFIIDYRLTKYEN